MHVILMALNEFNCLQKLKRVFEFRNFLLFFVNLLPNCIEDRFRNFSKEVYAKVFCLGFIWREFFFSNLIFLNIASRFGRK